MVAPTPYLALPGTAREALSFSHSVFGGELSLRTYDDFGRSDGPADAIAHGGEVVTPLERREWGDHDGVVRDRFGIDWLIGFRG